MAVLSCTRVVGLRRGTCVSGPRLRSLRSVLSGLFLSILFGLSFPQPAASQGVAYVRSAGNSGESVAYTVSIAPAAGDFLAVVVWQVEGAATPGSVTDNRGSVYTKDCDVTYDQGFGLRRVTVYHLQNAQSGITGVTIVPNRSSRGVVAEYSGMPASGAVLDVCGGVNTQTGVTSWTSGAGVTSGTDLVLGLADTGFSGNAGYGASGTWAGRLAQHDGADGDDAYLEDKVGVGAGSYTATGTTTQSVGESSVVVGYKTNVVELVAPVITSASSTAFGVGVAGTFTVTATGSPAPTLDRKSVV